MFILNFHLISANHIIKCSISENEYPFCCLPVEHVGCELELAVFIKMRACLVDDHPQ